MNPQDVVYRRFPAIGDGRREKRVFSLVLVHIRVEGELRKKRMEQKEKKYYGNEEKIERKKKGRKAGKKKEGK